MVECQQVDRYLSSGCDGEDKGGHRGAAQVQQVTLHRKHDMTIFGERQDSAQYAEEEKN